MRISVACGGFDEAADAARTANHVAALVTESLAGKLAGFAGMAGDDSTSAEFAAAYDAGAQEAVAATADLAHAFIGLGRLLAATGAHHLRAELSAARVVGSVSAGLTSDAFVRVSPTAPPSSLGAQEPSFGAVDRWILDHVEGFVWPSGDVGLLRDAATAWRRAAESVAGLVDHVASARSFLEPQVSPEVPVALDCLADVEDLVLSTADELAALGTACEEHAAAVEAVHDRTRALLEEVASMVVEGVAISALITALSGPFGGSLGAGALLERIRAVAPRFHALISSLRLTVASTAARLRTGRETLVGLRARFDRYARVAVRDERGSARIPGSGFGRWRAGWLREHEVPPGHTVSEHVGKSIDELEERIRREGMRRASSFATEADAEEILSKVLRDRAEEIADWLRTRTDKKLELDAFMQTPTGITVTSSGAQTAHSVRVVLIPSKNSATGWQLLTAFPK